MQCRPNPRRWLVLAHLEHATGSRRLLPLAPSGLDLLDGQAIFP